MPNIKPELRKGIGSFIHTRQGELALVLIVGGVLWTLGAAAVGAAIVFVSETLYPFSYVFVRTPLHGYLPLTVTEPKWTANLIFGSSFTLAIYTFEKNIFFRRFNLALKSVFASVAACAFVFVSGSISYLFEFVGAGILSLFLFEADAPELPFLLIYYFLAALPLFSLCDGIRRRIFLLP